MAVDAEGFLDDDESGDGFSLRTRDVRVEFMTVGCVELHVFAHGAS
jgi:hypothetical protein